MIDYQLVVDNDVFTFDLEKDQYYSSGIFPAVRWLADSTQNAKVIHSVQLNHRVYTPSWVGWEFQSQFDRPYAGLLSLSLTRDHYFFSNQYLKLQLELGWMGPGSMVGETQETWHRWFGMPIPRGWKYQINNTPIINGYVAYIKPLYDADHFKISSETNVSLGTVFNYMRQEVTFKTGKLLALHQSAYVSSALGNQRKEKLPNPKTIESYFFYSPGLEYVIYNATIEGNLIGPPSIYTENAYRWIWQHRAGVMFSWPRFDLGFTVYWRTRANTNATNHSYAGIRMNQRF